MEGPWKQRTERTLRALNVGTSVTFELELFHQQKSPVHIHRQRDQQGLLNYCDQNLQKNLQKILYVKQESFAIDLYGKQIDHKINFSTLNPKTIVCG